MLLHGLVARSAKPGCRHGLQCYRRTRRSALAGSRRIIDDPTGSYRTTFMGMGTQRVTVSLPQEFRRTAQEIADARGVPFSMIVSQALTNLARGHLIDAWVADFEARNGVFTETELQRIAAEHGVPYIPPADAASAAWLASHGERAAAKHSSHGRSQPSKCCGRRAGSATSRRIARRHRDCGHRRRTAGDARCARRSAADQRSRRPLHAARCSQRPSDDRPRLSDTLAQRP